MDYFPIEGGLTVSKLVSMLEACGLMPENFE
jgi:hypothetical protein